MIIILGKMAQRIRAKQTTHDEMQIRKCASLINKYVWFSLLFFLFVTLQIIGKLLRKPDSVHIKP